MRVITVNGTPTGPMLTSGDVARLAGVDPKTVTRWVRKGKLTAQRSAGGHRRFKASDVAALLGITGEIDVVVTPDSNSDGGAR